MEDIIDIENIYKKIGENVARERKNKGLSQLQLSLKMGHNSVSIVSAAERYYRKKHFNLEHLFQIAAILEIEVSVLIDTTTIEE